MSLTLSNLKPAKGATKKRKRVGRGGKRGTYSGRGLKGQRSRSGGKSGLKALGFKQTLQRIPKLRGFKSLKPKMVVINLSDLNNKFKDGDTVDFKALLKSGLVDSTKTGVKLLGRGELSKKLNISVTAFSASAKIAVENTGGKIVLVEKKKPVKKAYKK